jgi:hypothetical protein
MNGLISPGYAGMMILFPSANDSVDIARRAEDEIYIY